MSDSRVKDNILKMRKSGATSAEIADYLKWEQSRPAEDTLPLATIGPDTPRQKKDIPEAGLFVDSPERMKYNADQASQIWNEAVGNVGEWGISPETRQMFGDPGADATGVAGALRPFTKLPADVADSALRLMQGAQVLTEAGAKHLDKKFQETGLADALSVDGNKFLPGSGAMAWLESHPLGGMETGVVPFGTRFSAPANDVLSAEARAVLNKQAQDLFDSGATYEQMQEFAKGKHNPFDEATLKEAIAKRDGPQDAMSGSQQLQKLRDQGFAKPPRKAEEPTIPEVDTSPEGREAAFNEVRKLGDAYYARDEDGGFKQASSKQEENMAWDAMQRATARYYRAYGDEKAAIEAERNLGNRGTSDEQLRAFGDRPEYLFQNDNFIDWDPLSGEEPPAGLKFPTLEGAEKPSVVVNDDVDVPLTTPELAPQPVKFSNPDTTAGPFAGRLRQNDNAKPLTQESTPSGSFGEGNTAQPVVSEAAKIAGEDISKKSRSKKDTKQAGEELGLTVDNYGAEGSIGEISPVVARGVQLTKEVSQNVIDDFVTTGDISDATRDKWKSVTDTTSDNLSESSRALSSAYDPEEGLAPSVSAELITLIDETKKKGPKKVAALQQVLEEAQGDAQAIERIVADSRQRDVLDYANGVWYTNVLSSFKTQIYNSLGYAHSLIQKGPRDLAGITLNKTLGPAIDFIQHRIFKQGAKSKQPVLSFKGSVASILPEPKAALMEAIAAAGRGWKTGLSHRYEDIKNISRGGQKALWWEIPRKGMTAVDEFFGSILERQERTARAYAYADMEGLKGDAHTARVAELVNESRVMTKSKAYKLAREQAKTEGLDKKDIPARVAQLVEENAAYQVGKGAEEYSADMRFQKSDKIAEIVNKLVYRTKPFHEADFPEKIVQIGQFALQKIIPFMNTTQNLLRAGNRSYGVGILSKTNLKGLASGNTIERQRALGNLGISSLTTFTVANMIAQGILTGAEPTDPKERNEWELTGKRPFSYKTEDGEWVSYKGFEPVSTPVGAMATVLSRYKESDDTDATVNRLVSSMADLTEVYSKAGWLSSMPIFAALTEHSGKSEDRLVRTAADTTASFVNPAIVKDIADYVTGDKRAVDLKGDGTFTRRLSDKIKQTWFQSTELPQQVDALGNLKNKDSVIGPDFLSRVSKSKETTDPVVKELQRLDSLPREVTAQDLRKFKASREEVLAYQTLSGQYIKSYMTEAIKSPEWKTLTKAEKAKEVNGIFRDMRAQAREDLFPEHYLPQKAEAPQKEATTTQPQEEDDPWMRAGQAAKDSDYNSLAVGAVLAEFPDAAIISNHRAQDDPLTKANPTSFHAAGYDAIDVRPIEGMTFDEFIAQLEAAGYPINPDSRDETGANKSAWATGDHWHVVIDTSD